MFTAEKEKRATDQAQRDLKIKMVTQIEGIDENINLMKEDIQCKMEDMSSKIELNEKSNTAIITGIENNYNNSIASIEDKYAKSIASIEENYAKSIAGLKLSIEGLDARLTEKIDSSIQMLVDKQNTVLRRLEEGLAQQNNDVSFFKNDAADLIEKVSEVSEKILDFEKNKRNNLIIYGIPNDSKETPSSLDMKVRSEYDLEIVHMFLIHILDHTLNDFLSRCSILKEKPTQHLLR